ncbi:nitrate reductase molybdenum cofactor assembly chaperone [Mycolicibacterium pyrenivorans]|uniref:nitrate reductase molybdenum cofactor assembly chaperone n=1 Tax=Mycolicibacterium pyrenivorans TaxID=187102 RepID=UPI0021F26A58|nr:nitrate reductase molybdenum cofactor assembly chaperone [Mycolicibacterium pyrenivorans]MCV7151327.1 nitrate reductase molybdenum cofactor assembly chaperone [Mycolicibacterium pyrenivorans]
MRLLNRARGATVSLQDRLVWQCASLLLAYPDDHLTERLRTVDELRAPAAGPAADLLARTVTALASTPPMRAAAEYVETFDLRRRSTMYLTYWTAGDTRNRGREMHAFTQAYLDAGVHPPADEAPDHLPVVLEFAATVDPVAGRRLLIEHRVPIGVLHDSLTERRSPYADTIAAVCATLPARGEQDERRAQQLAQVGPPTESVGLAPFTLTVPPRRSEGGR